MTPQIPASALISSSNLSDNLDSAPPTTRPSTPRWRWWVALILMGGAPLFLAFVALRHQMSGDASGPMLPTTLPQLLRFCGWELGVFAVVWGVAWAFSRPTREQLFFRPLGVEGLLKSLVGGFGYSLLMRLVVALVTIVIFMWLALLRFDVKHIAETIQSSSKVLQHAFSPAFAGHSALYNFLFIVLLSFVVAGTREELWRATMIACIVRLAPATWTSGRQNGLALAISSTIFGIAHAYQGVSGIATTGILGVALGTIMLRHKSIWPAVFAHGFFDALSFGLLAWQSLRK